MLEYLARGPLSEDRLSKTASGHIKLKLKTPWGNGRPHLEFTPEEFLEKLVALVPPPNQSWTRWNGVFASSSKLRSQIVLHPEKKKGMSFPSQDCNHQRKGLKNSNWAKNLARTFEIDVSECKCGGTLYPIAAVKDHMEAARYLEHVGLPHEPPQRAPPSLSLVSLNFDGHDGQHETEDLPTINIG